MSELRIILKTDGGTIVTGSEQRPSSETIDQLQKLVSEYPGNWEVELDHGTIKTLKPISPVAVDLPAKDFSRTFLAQFSKLFGITADSAAYVIEYNLRSKRVVEYRQVVNNVPVEQSFITFAVEDSHLRLVTSRVYSDLNANQFDVTPAFQNVSACEIAANDFAGASNQTPANVTCKGALLILPENGKYFLTWKVVINATKGLNSYTYYVDARDGSIVKKYSNLRSQKAQSPQPGLMSKEEASASLNPTSLSRASHINHDANKLQQGESNKNTPTITAPASNAAAWETILSENFDVNNFPYSPWREFDNNGSTGGELYWDDQNCVSNSPNWSLWAADEGANHLNACSDNYANDMDSWVVYGPFSLANSTDGSLEFHYNNVSELNFDYFKWMASVDGTNFSGFKISGNSNGWQNESLDFKNVPTLGNITGRSQVWIAFAFTTDSSAVSGKGAFVDDVTIKRFVDSSCAGVSGHVGGHIYGKNKNELLLRDFKNMKVVLNKTLAFDSYAVTNSTGNYSSADCSDYVRFELEGYGSANFVSVHDCNNGNCFLGGDLLASQDFPFNSQVNFDWNEGDENKKEVSVFWHLNEMHDWYKNLVGQDLLNYQMQAYVDYIDFEIDPRDQMCSNGTINAFYTDTDENIYFCPSDVSRESDVIYHEYTHGLVHHIPNYSLPYQDESGAIDEGLADYFAAAKNEDSIIGEGLPPQYQRSLTAPINYSDKCSPETSICRTEQYFARATTPDRNKNDYGFVHHNSLVPSGALWNLRQSPGLSGNYVDELIIDTLILRKPLSFIELLNGLIAQDGGSHASQIRAAFAARGVVAGTACTYFLEPSSQIFIASASSGSFNVVTGSGCTWNAVGSVGWLTTNSTGTGNGTVNYSVAANTVDARSGAISVGGQTFTVFQSAGNGSGCPTTTISLGQTISATLTTGCMFTGTARYVDPYQFTGTAGQQVVIAMNSTVFDAYLFLDGPDNHTIAQDDDSGGGTNSRIPTTGAAFTLPLSGTYRIYATSYSADGLSGSTGSYSLSLLNGATLTAQFSSSSLVVNEGSGAITVIVTRSGSTASAATVDYKTQDTDTFSFNCAQKQGKAFGRCDFGTVVGTLSFAAGETSKAFLVPIVNDAFAEGDETFSVVLNNPTGVTLGAPSTATVTINDNETVDQPNPILQTNAAGVSFFVRQQYLDFLGREPEGGEPWSAIVNGCADQFNTNPSGATAGCDRINVSGSFFGSPEYKTKGFYVIGMYRVAFGRLPSYSEFSVDLASISGTTAAEVFAKRAAYASNFVQRNEFKAHYENNVPNPNTDYVNALMSGALGQNYNLTSITTRDPASPDTGNKVTLTRTDLINALNGSTLTRAQVLRAIVQSDEISLQKEAVNAFVASQYYGYLRRTPDAGGFNSWFTYLTANPNDFRTMINGFLNSAEYRLRFGPRQ